MTSPSVPPERVEAELPPSIRPVERAWREGYRLHVQDVPAWLPTLADEAKALASLAKAWPVLAKHADHIDGEFDLALTDVRKMLIAMRAEIAAYASTLRAAQQESWKAYRAGFLEGMMQPSSTYERDSAIAEGAANRYAALRTAELAASTREGASHE